MRYMLLIYDSPELWAALSDEERNAQLQEYMTLAERYPQVRGGHELQPATSATTVRVQGTDVLTTDGPFAETKEQLAGFYLVEARDLNEAIQVAARIPPARAGSIEVRPVRELAP